jgi:hypothetical protein
LHDVAFEGEEVAQDPILRLFQLPFNVFLFYDYDEDNNLYA